VQGGDAVAVGVGLDDAAGEAQVAGQAAEEAGAEEGEGLVAVEEQVGVDRGEADAVEAAGEVVDGVAEPRGGRVGDGCEGEGVRARAADEQVAVYVRGAGMPWRANTSAWKTLLVARMMASGSSMTTSPWADAREANRYV
jgi:hypothetical protein